MSKIWPGDDTSDGLKRKYRGFWSDQRTVKVIYDFHNGLLSEEEAKKKLLVNDGDVKWYCKDYLRRGKFSELNQEKPSMLPNKAPNDFVSNLRGRSEKVTCQSKWTFSPVNAKCWATSSVRILLVGAEPNGDKNYYTGQCMGDWFRSARPANKYYNGRRFYTVSMLHLIGALGKTDHELLNQPLNSSLVDKWCTSQSSMNDKNLMRFVDLKATPGGAAVKSGESIDQYVLNHLEDVLDYFRGDEAYAAPTMVVLQGSYAQSTYRRIIEPHLTDLIERKTFKIVAIEHPSSTLASYSQVQRACVELSSYATYKLTNAWSANQGWYLC